MRKTTPKALVALLTFAIGVALVACSLIYRHALTQIFTDLPFVFAPSEESEEYAVYSALIKDEFVKDNVKLLVISDQTLFYANPDYLNSTTNEDRIQQSKKFYPTVPEDAVIDFETKHLQPFGLSPKLNLPVKYKLIDKTRLERDKDGAGIRSFYEEFPKARGIISLSRVGFNRERNQAFARVEYTFCPLCSHGGMVFLRKEWGMWRVVENFGGWAS
jgi:hypothetical protein